MMTDAIVISRLEQICSSLVSEGYRVTGKLGAVRALKHPNGNRITVIATGNQIGIIKNGRLVKQEPVVVTAANNAPAKKP